ncbi:hypothetical protein EBZ38_06250 [bacterium]|nr:hypothetical protein [bacterium]
MKTRIFKERDLTFDVYGLRPLSRYYLYVNRFQYPSRTKQFGKKISDPLITDEDGKITIVFYIDSFIPSDTPKSMKAKANVLRATPIEFVLTNLNQSTLVQNFEDSSVSYAKSTLFL